MSLADCYTTPEPSLIPPEPVPDEDDWGDRVDREYDRYRDREDEREAAE